MDREIVLFLILSFLAVYVFGARASSDIVAVQLKDQSRPNETTYCASSGTIEADQTVNRTLQEDLTGAFQGGALMLQFSSVTDSVPLAPDSATFSRHVMSKDFQEYVYLKGFLLKHQITAIEPTTIFRPSDAMAVVVINFTTLAPNTKIEFEWYYRSDSNKSWIQIPWQNGWSPMWYQPQTNEYAAYLNISGWWPGYHYPRAYKIDVHVNDSPYPSFSEFFEVTNGGLTSPRMCEDIDANGYPVNMTSRFTKGVDTIAYHYLRFDKTAYFNNDTGKSHNFTTVWIQPNNSTYRTYNGTFADYKGTDETWNHWENRTVLDDYIPIDVGTPVGNWTVKVYLDWYLNNNTWTRYGPVATTPFIVGASPVKDWTFMVYLDTDNNLETPGINIFEKMASVGSTPDVNVVVQMDRIPGYNDSYGGWIDTKRFYVTQGMPPTAGNSIWDLGEKNMGDPGTLRDFVNWTIYKYPADHYFLALWDHGTGIVGVCYDFTDGYDSLSLPELSQALDGLPVILDVVFSDACDLNMIEIAYQIRDYANVLVGPEGLGYSPAPYDSYITRLTSNPSILPSALASGVVTDYINWSKSIPISSIPNATMSAVDLTKISRLTAAIDDFALRLNESVTPTYLSLLLASHEQILLARNLTQGFPGPYAGDLGYYIDLYDLAQVIKQSDLDEELRAAADQVMTALSIGNVIITATNKNLPNTHGLAISFPDNKTKYDSIGYGSIAFAKDTLWGEFLEYYLSGCVLTIRTPYTDLSLKVNQTSFTTDAYERIRVFVLPGSYIVNVTTPFLTAPGSRGVFTKWNDGETDSSRTITVNVSTTYTADYQTQYEVTFGQSGVGTDFTETVVIIDGTGYKVGSFPLSFWWNESTIHAFAFQSPLTVTPSTKRYVWNSTSGLKSLRSDSITVSTPGNVTGNYKVQFYLTLATKPAGISSLSGEGWYYNGTSASISTSEFIEKTPGASRYRFNNWTTDDVSEISASNERSTTVRMDEAKSVTANYIEQHYLTINSLYGSLTPTSGWVDTGESITASVTSPVSGPAGIRYVCTGWAGTGSVSTPGTNASVTFTLNAPSSITWNWKTQYLLTVRTDPAGLSPQPNLSPSGSWYDIGTVVNCTAQKISGRVFDHWTLDGASWETGVSSITVTMDEPCEVTAYYIRESAWWDIFLRPDVLQVALGLLGTVLTVAFVGAAWFRTRRRRGLTKALLKEIDDVYDKLSGDRQKCEEQLYRLRNTVLKGVTDGKISQEDYELIDGRIDKYMEELQKK